LVDSFFPTIAIAFFFYFVCSLGLPGLITCKILSVKEENGFEDEDVFLLPCWDLQWVHSISSNGNNPFVASANRYVNRIVANQKL